MSKYIDLTKLYDALMQYKRSFDDEDMQQAIQGVADILAETETAEVAPVNRGYWVAESKIYLGEKIVYPGEKAPFNIGGFPAGSCSCSVCGDWLTASDEYATRGNYCPNCGAKMDGKQNE